MLNKIFKPVLLGVIFLLMATLSSCEKSKETTAIIIVKNINGENVINATVTLHQDGQISPQGNTTNPDIKKTQNTDANGRVSFTYDLPAILNIEVLKIEGNNTYTGGDIIRLLEGKSTTKVVEIS